MTWREKSQQSALRRGYYVVYTDETDTMLKSKGKVLKTWIYQYQNG